MRQQISHSYIWQSFGTQLKLAMQKGERSGSYFFLLIRLIGIWNWDELVNEISNPLIENMVICLDPPTPEHTRLLGTKRGPF